MLSWPFRPICAHLDRGSSFRFPSTRICKNEVQPKHPTRWAFGSIYGSELMLYIGPSCGAEVSFMPVRKGGLPYYCNQQEIQFMGLAEGAT